MDHIIEANSLIDAQITHSNQSFVLWNNGKLGNAILSGDREETQKLYESGMSFLSENARYHSEYILVKPESFIYDLINDFIYHCHQYGFFQHFESINFPLPPIPTVKDTRKILTMNMLSAGFYLWIISVIVACVVFFAERIVFYFYY